MAAFTQTPDLLETEFAIANLGCLLESLILCQVSKLLRGVTIWATHLNRLDFATVVAHSLEDLLNLLEKAVVEDGDLQLDDTEMTGAFGLVFFASRTAKVPIDSTEMRIVWTSLTRFEAGLIPTRVLDDRRTGSVFSSYVHRLWIVNVDDREALRLLGGEETELDFLDGARRSARVWEMHVRHDCGVSRRR